MSRSSTRTFAFPNTSTPQEVISEIERNYSSNNPSIGKIQSCFIRNGPMIYKFAMIQQIVDSERIHHHNILILESYKKLKGGWEHQEERKITLDDKDSDEIGILEKFILEYKTYNNQEKKTLGVITSQQYDKFEKVVSSQVGKAIEEILEDADNYQKIIKEGGLILIKDVIQWVFTEENSNAIVEKLKDLELNSLQEITTIAGITQINKILELWKLNTGNNSEEFWQKTLSDFSWIISQLFSTPVILYEEKAYVGGKFVDNKGGNLLDFLYKHHLTGNVSLIEIKTPSTELVGNKYRQTFSMSEELSGAINQTLNYKHKIQKHYISLKADAGDKEAFEVINPKTLLIIGHLTNELSGDSSKLEAFELYRQNLKDVLVVTFDELFSKIEILKSILETGH